MRTHTSSLFRRVFKFAAVMLVLVILLGVAGSVETRAADPGPQPTPFPPPSILAGGAGEEDAQGGAWGWYDGDIEYSSILNCISIIQGNPYWEYGAGTYVGQWADPSNSLPIPGMVYYVHVVFMALGNSCSGQYAYVDIGLPANTSLAISGTNPVFCYTSNGQFTAECPQYLPASSQNSGAYNIPSPAEDLLWIVPEGLAYEFQIPVVSSTTVSGSEFQAAVHMFDGNSSPWLVPGRAVYVYSPPAPGYFSKSSPSNGASSQPTNPTLQWGTSSNATSYAYCIDTSNNSTCNSSWVSTGTSKSKSLSGLSPNTTYYWQVRATNSGGTTYANSGSWWSFTTQSVASSEAPIISPVGFRGPPSIIRGSGASGPNQWLTKVVLGREGDTGTRFNFVVWLHIPDDWTLPWARQYSFTGDFLTATMSADWNAQSWIGNPSNCPFGGAASSGYKWRAFKGTLEQLPLVNQRLNNALNLRGGLGVPSGETLDNYGDVRVIVGSYYDSNNNATPDKYSCDQVVVTNITVR